MTSYVLWYSGVIIKKLETSERLGGEVFLKDAFIAFLSCQQEMCRTHKFR
jgi:hypothetical protein